MTPEHIPETPRRRRRRKRTKKQKLQAWFQEHGANMLLGFLFVTSSIPLLGFTFSLKYSSGWLGGISSLWQAIIQLLAGFTWITTTIIGTFRIRERITHHKPWWDRACPICGESDIRRVHRSTLDHLICRIGIPVRRYSCRHCSWRGPRIYEKRVP